MTSSNLAFNYQPVLLSEEERRTQTKMIMSLFEHWKLTYRQQAILLGLSPMTATSIHRYKNLKTHLPLYRDIQDRIGHFFAIHKYLRRIYPMNKKLAYRWITTPNQDFNNLSPYDIISKEGYPGVLKIRGYLEVGQTFYRKLKAKHKKACSGKPSQENSQSASSMTKAVRQYGLCGLLPIVKIKWKRY